MISEPIIGATLIEIYRNDVTYLQGFIFITIHPFLFPEVTDGGATAPINSPLSNLAIYLNFLGNHMQVLLNALA